MGDRAVIVFTDGGRCSPVVYLHWNGTEVPEWLKEHKDLMEGRENDLEYAAARFVGIAHSHISGNMSLGMWNLSPEDQLALATNAPGKLAEMSHGDAGAILVNVLDFSWQAFGGYLKEGHG